MSENEKPDWLGELAKGGEALQREAMRLVKAAEELAASGPARPLARRIVRAMGASLRELAAPEPAAANVTVTAGLATASAAAMVTAVGSVTLPKMRISGEGTVQQPDLIERNLGRILALVVLAIVTSGLLGVQGPDRATVDHYLTVLSFALPIAMVIWAGRK
jgi:hypothetical protein